MLQVRCPGCSTILSLADSQAGSTGRCPDCGQGFCVPVPGARAAAAAGRSSAAIQAASRSATRSGEDRDLDDSSADRAHARLPASSETQAGSHSSTPGKLSGRRRRRRRRPDSSPNWTQIAIAGACILLGGGAIFGLLSYLFGGAGVLLIIIGAIIWLIGMAGIAALRAQDDSWLWYLPFGWTVMIATKIAEDPLGAGIPVLLRFIGIGMVLLGIWVHRSGRSPEGNRAPEPHPVRPAGQQVTPMRMPQAPGPVPRGGMGPRPNAFPRPGRF
jgi:hypothetical protein